MVAVLEDALDIVLRDGGARSRPQLFGETLRWLLSNEAAWPFSFIRVCEALGIDPNHMRRRLWDGAPPLTDQIENQPTRE